MKLKSRIILFSTFFGNCFIIGLLTGSFTTDNFINAIAQKLNPVSEKKSEGKINFGLFHGYKNLNYGYGLRTNEINVIELLKTDPDIMSYWLWFFSALALGFSLFCSAVSSVASIIGSIRKHGSMFLLVTSHIACAIGQFVCIICWILQVYLYLRHNLLSAEDRRSWTTTDNVYFGYSFYLVAIAFCIVLFNFVLMAIARKIENKENCHLVQPIDEKTEGAIMLY